MEEFQLPNSRLLYKKSKGSSNWMPLLMEIDQAIEDHPRLQRASDEFHLYFFKPGSELSAEDDLWVAREIIGHLNPGELEDMETYDLAKGKALGLVWDLSDQLNFEEVVNKEKELRNAANRDLAGTWRVSFIREKSGIKAKIGLF